MFNRGRRQLGNCNLEAAVTDRDYDLKLEELERILNDPAGAMEPAKVWSLLAEVSQHDQVRPA